MSNHKIHKSKKLTSKKKRLTIGLLSVGSVGLVGALIAGTVAATKSINNDKLQLLVGKNDSSFELGSSVKAGLDGLSPLAFNQSYAINNQIINTVKTPNYQPTYSMYQTTLKQLNNIGFNWLNVKYLNKLEITHYYLAKKATYESSSLVFAAVQLINPNNMPVTFQYACGSTNYSTIIPANKTIWVYANNQKIEITSNLNLNKSLVDSFNVNYNNLFTIYGLNNSYKEVNNQLSAPKLPIQTSLQVAKNVLDNGGYNIVAADFYNFFNYLNSGAVVKVTNPAVVNITFSNIKVNWNGSEFIPASASKTGYAQFVLGGISGTLNITGAVNLQLKIINNEKLTFNLIPLVLWKNNNQIQTSPSIASNNLGGTTFNATPNSNQPTNSSDLRFGYSIKAVNPQSLVKLSLQGQVFNTMQVAYSYIFYNYWMTNRTINKPVNNKKTNLPIPNNLNAKYLDFDDPFNFGSIYQNGIVNLKGNTTLPSSWKNALINNQTLNNELVSRPISSNQILDYLNKNITDFYSGKKFNDLTVTVQTDPNLFLKLLDITKLNNLNPNLSVKSFNITIKEINNVVSTVVNSAKIYNIAYEQNANKPDAYEYSTIYYLKVNKTNYPIYPSPTSTLATSIPLNIALYNIVTKTNDQNIKLDALISLDYSSLDNNYFANDENSASDVLALLNSKNSKIDYQTKFKDALIQYLETTNSLFNNFIIQNLTYKLNANNTITITSFELLNKTQNEYSINFANKNININPYQTVIITNYPIVIFGFSQVVNINKLVNIQNTSYSNLLLNNFALNANNHSNHNLMMINAISNLIANNEIKVLNYQAKISNFNNSSLSNTRMTYGNNESVVLKPSETKTISSNNLVSIYNFKSFLTPSNSDIMNSYLAKCQSWLNTLTTNDIQNDFNQMSNVHNYISTIPSQTNLNYENYQVKISNYNPKTNTATLDSMHWLISGTAQTGVSLEPSVSISVSLNQTAPVQFKLVPIIYYQQPNSNVVQSYPSIISTPSNLKHIVIVNKYVSIKTELDYANVPSAVNITNIKFGYYIEPATQSMYSSNAGSGLALKLSGSDAQYKPTLNISYAFNNFVMAHHYDGLSKVCPTPILNTSGAYGSYNDQTFVAKLKNQSESINPYAAIAFSSSVVMLNQPNINNFIELYNYVDNPNSYAYIAKQLGLPANVKILNISLDGINKIGSITLQNNSLITYKWIENVNNEKNAYFIYPQNKDQIINFNQNASINILNNKMQISSTINYNAYKLYENSSDGSNIYNFFDNSCYWNFGYQYYLYPLLFTSYTREQYYSFNFNKVGVKNYHLMDKKSWTAYCDATSSPTYTMTEVASILGLQGNLINDLQAYNIYISATNNKTVVISSLKINNLWISGLNLNIYAGNESNWLIS